ncbi:uncharacterized protein LOC141581930 [Saimiri boliviensis]|uniref:uncharacterized protein LOC141581930 n=1 Tax=Saimiri boliviensis TaxID=27679 RepID=UPI003D76E887
MSCPARIPCANEPDPSSCPGPHRPPAPTAACAGLESAEGRPDPPKGPKARGAGVPGPWGRTRSRTLAPSAKHLHGPERRGGALLLKCLEARPLWPAPQIGLRPSSRSRRRLGVPALRREIAGAGKRGQWAGDSGGSGGRGPGADPRWRELVPRLSPPRVGSSFSLQSLLGFNNPPPVPPTCSTDLAEGTDDEGLSGTRDGMGVCEGGRVPRGGHSSGGTVAWEGLLVCELNFSMAVPLNLTQITPGFVGFLPFSKASPGSLGSVGQGRGTRTSIRLLPASCSIHHLSSLFPSPC